MPPNQESVSSQAAISRPEVLLQLVRFLAAESSQVIITNHAEERMYQRGITSKMLFDTLKKGLICGDIEPAKKGDLKLKLTHKIPNLRHVGVVTVVKREEQLIIVTVEWEDGK